MIQWTRRWVVLTSTVVVGVEESKESSDSEYVGVLVESHRE